MLWPKVSVREPWERQEMLLLQLFCVMARLGEEHASLPVHGQQYFLPALALSNQDPSYSMQRSAIEQGSLLSQREALEQCGSGSHKLFYFELCLALSPGKQHCWEQQTLGTCLN